MGKAIRKRVLNIKNPRILGHHTHHDLHKANIKYCKKESPNSYEVFVFDTDLLVQCWFLADVGAVLFDHQLSIELACDAYASETGRAKADELLRQFCAVLISEYEAPFDYTREQLRECCDMRRDLVKVAFGRLEKAGMGQDGPLAPKMKVYRQHYDEINSAAMCGLI